VLVDEVALPLAAMRLRPKGSPGGHNGLKDVQRMVGSGDYARLRIGIRPEDERRLGGDLADFVLAKFGKDEAAFVREALPRMVEAVECWVAHGVLEAMNRFN
jgi:PTH1 family peptidyl-tRNA hydrolase